MSNVATNRKVQTIKEVSLSAKIGEQKIDVITYHFGAPSLAIQQEARKTGIRLK